MELKKLKTLDLDRGPAWKSMSSTRRWTFVLFFVMMPMVSMLTRCTAPNAPMQMSEESSYVMMSADQQEHDATYDAFYPALLEHLQDGRNLLTWSNGGTLFTETTGKTFVDQSDMDYINEQVDMARLYGPSRTEYPGFFQALANVMLGVSLETVGAEEFSQRVESYLYEHPALSPQTINGLTVAASSYRLAHQHAMRTLLTDYIGGDNQSLEDCIACDAFGFVMGAGGGAIACSAGYVIGKLVQKWLDDYQPPPVEFDTRWNIALSAHRGAFTTYYNALDQEDQRVLSSGSSAVGTTVFDDLLLFFCNEVEPGSLSIRDIPIGYAGMIPSGFRPYWANDENENLRINWKYWGMCGACVCIGFACAYY
jgi:hypothetical protein